MNQIKSKPISLLLFDVGGVLVQTMDESFRMKWENRLGIENGKLEPAVHDTPLFRQLENNEISINEFWQQITNELGISQHEIEDFRRDFYAGDQLNEELIEHIRQWRQSYQIGIISNAAITLRETLTYQFGIIDLFDRIIASSDVGVRKPDPRIYKAALEAFGVEANQSIFVDDLPPNIQGAEEVGIHGILYTNNDDVLRQINNLLTNFDAK